MPIYCSIPSLSDERASDLATWRRLFSVLSENAMGDDTPKAAVKFSSGFDDTNIGSEQSPENPSNEIAPPRAPPFAPPWGIPLSITASSPGKDPKLGENREGSEGNLAA